MTTSKSATTITTYALLAVIAAISLLLPEQLSVPGAWGQSAPAQIRLLGVVRDFRAAHADFGVVPPEGLGATAGSVDQALSAVGRPVFTSGGFKVASDWTDGAGRPIAPHLPALGGGAGGGPTLPALPRNPQIVADVELRFRMGTVVDSYDSSVGTYGGTNVGSEAYIAVNATAAGSLHVDTTSTLNGDGLVGPGADPAVAAHIDGTLTGTVDVLSEALPMPALVPPAGPPFDGPSSGSLTIKNPTTISTDQHVDELKVRRDGTLTISGKVTILCEGKLTLERNATIIVPDGSSLKIYCRTEAKLLGPNSVINPDSSDPSKVQISMIGADPVLDKLSVHAAGSLLCGQVFSRTITDVANSAEFYGTFIGPELDVQGGQIHMDSSNVGGGTLGWNVILVVEDAGALSADDLACQALIESWGHTVTVIADEASEATVDALIADNDVVYIRADADDTVIKENLVHAPIGVVNASTKVRHKLGWPTSSAGKAIVTDIYITDNTHCISSHLPTGLVTLFTSPQPVRPTGAPYANGSAMLGTETALTARPLLQTLEIGDILFDGSPANGRRVQLPWGDSKQGFQFGSLTPDAQELMRVSLDWAADATWECGIVLPACVTISDTDGSAGAASDGGISSSSTFDQWFATSLGNNLAMHHTVTLLDNGAGVYEYLDNAFFPVDDRMFANEGQDHNNFFTYAVKAWFNYGECTNQFVDFEGSDGAWLFIDGRLVMDLGGVAGGGRQYIQVDRLGLTDGQRYPLHLFYAQRREDVSVFRLRTNIELTSPVMVGGVSAGFD